MTTVMKVSGLSKHFGGVRAVQDVSFELGENQLLALIGPNGAGKTTCFNMLTGQLKSDSGSILMLGKEMTGLKPRQIWRLGVARTFQITETFASMTVSENVQMALMSHEREMFGFWARAKDRYVPDALELLMQVDMADQARRPCAELAYGDLKRLELAVALAHSPRILLMDEPTAGMAPGERKSLMALVAGLVGKGGVSVLFTEHDMDIVFGHAEKVMVLDQGELVAAGTPAEVRANPLVQEIYLGQPARIDQSGDEGAADA